MTFLHTGFKPDSNTRYIRHSQSTENPLTPIFLSVFTITDTGPGVIYKDIDSIPSLDIDNIMLDSVLGKMAIGYITALGLGNEYCEGVFDLPASNLPGYRLFLVSVKLYNPDAIDPRLHIGLYQFALFLPVEYMKQLPANSAMETAIISIVKSEIKYADRIVPEILVPLKNRLTRYLDNQISKRNAERLINEIK